ncbi:MAG: hypothetical protein ACTSPO_14085 [Candidatus Heimdallarchaeaceae archaeon]
MKVKSFKDFRVWIPLADLSFDDLSPYHFEILKYLFSYVKDNDARKMADYCSSWETFDNVFWENKNNLYYLDERIHELFYKYNSGAVIVITGIKSATGVGKSWSAISLALRYSEIFGRKKITNFSLDNIFMEEREIEKIQGFERNIYILDDPQLSSTGAGSQRITETLKKFTRISSRFSKSSLFICSAIDMFQNKKLVLDGVHFYLEVWGYSPRERKSLAMLYDNDHSCIGWCYIPDPTLPVQNIKHPEVEELIEKKIRLEYQDEEITSKKLLHLYETIPKKQYVENQINQQFSPAWASYINSILDDDQLERYASKKTNLSTLVAKRFPNLTKDERTHIITEVWLYLQDQDTLTQVSDIIDDYYINSDEFSFDKKKYLEDLVNHNKKWTKDVEAYRLNIFKGEEQDKIAEVFGETQGNISNRVRRVKGELARVTGLAYEKFLEEKYRSFQEVVNVERFGGQSEPDLIIHYSNGSIDVVSVKCFYYRRSTLTIPISELKTELKKARELKEQGEFVNLVLEVYNINTCERIKRIISCGDNFQSPPTNISMRLATKPKEKNAFQPLPSSVSSAVSSSNITAENLGGKKMIREKGRITHQR